MKTALFTLAVMFLLFGACIVVMNWRCVLIGARNRRRGVSRHHSTVPIVTVILAAVAYQLYPGPEKTWIIALPFLDIANWQLLWLPVVWLRRSNTGREQGPKVPPDRTP